MIVIVCLDTECGMMFADRRQSRDHAVTERIKEICNGKTLWMDPYSARLYGSLEEMGIRVEDDFLSHAKKGDFCLVETRQLAFVEAEIEGIYVFWWNRTYPSDLHFDLDLTKWKKVSRKDFSGSSHEKITEEYYIRNGEKL